MYITDGKDSSRQVIYNIDCWLINDKASARVELTVAEVTNPKPQSLYPEIIMAMLRTSSISEFQAKYVMIKKHNWKGSKWPLPSLFQATCFFRILFSHPRLLGICAASRYPRTRPKKCKINGFDPSQMSTSIILYFLVSAINASAFSGSSHWSTKNLDWLKVQSADELCENTYVM